MASYLITAPEGRIQGTIQLPGSKSASNRELIIRAIHGLSHKLQNLSPSTDTLELTAALRKRVPQRINAGEGGAPYRFLLAYLCTRSGVWELEASGSMQQRPIGPGVDALRTLGAQIDYLGKEGFPPVRIVGSRMKGGTVHVDATISSQFISALMLIGPTMRKGLRIHLKGEVVSQSYIELTAYLMKRWGAGVQVGTKVIKIAWGPYWHYRKSHAIEADWSAASPYYLVTAFSEDAAIELPGLDYNSIQGDSVLTELGNMFGVETMAHVRNQGVLLLPRDEVISDITMEISGTPDLVPYLAVWSIGQNIPMRMAGIDHLAWKESNRLEALARELPQVGGSFSREGEYWVTQPGPLPEGVPEIYSHGDHRIAMAFAPLSMLTGQILIRQPEVVAKSYPAFWEDLKSLGFGITEV